MKLFYVYPEALPSSKARTTTVVHSVTELSGLFETTLVVPTRGGSREVIETAYGVDLRSVRFLMLSKTFLGLRSNKFFNDRLLKSLPKTEEIVIVLRHLKAAEALLKHRRKNWHIVFECHELFCQTQADPRKASHLHKQEAFVYSQVDALIFISEPLKKEANALLGPLAEKQEVLPMGVDIKKAYVPKDFSHINEIYYVGGFQAWKGLDVLLKAFAKLEGAPYLKIAGSGSSERETELRALAERLGVASRVEWLGQLPQAQVGELLATRSKLCVLPNIPSSWSHYTMPLKLFEYAGGGNIIVYSHIPTLEPLATEYGAFGVKVPAGDPDALAEALTKVIAAPMAYVSLVQASHRMALAHSWEARARKIFEFCHRAGFSLFLLGFSQPWVTVGTSSADLFV
jgi:glycosyltransferase involved in cell wall biosynthesis